MLFCWFLHGFPRCGAKGLPAPSFLTDLGGLLLGDDGSELMKGFREGFRCEPPLKPNCFCSPSHFYTLLFCLAFILLQISMSQFLHESVWEDAFSTALAEAMDDIAPRAQEGEHPNAFKFIDYLTDVVGLEALEALGIEEAIVEVERVESTPSPPALVRQKAFSDADNSGAVDDSLLAPLSEFLEALEAQDALERMTKHETPLEAASIVLPKSPERPERPERPEPPKSPKSPDHNKENRPPPETSDTLATPSTPSTLTTPTTPTKRLVGIKKHRSVICARVINKDYYCTKRFGHLGLCEQ